MISVVKMLRYMLQKDRLELSLGWLLVSLPIAFLILIISYSFMQLTNGTT